MGRFVVHNAPIPPASLGARAFDRIDYADAYQIAMPDGATTDVDAFARCFLTATPRWSRILMGVRERAARLIGLKRITDGSHRDPAAMTFQPGTRAGIFRVFARSADEILVGEDDRHLDFRVSLLVREEAGCQWGIVTTVVRYHGWTGRAYFTPVRLFHRWIVRAMLRETATRFARETTQLSQS